MGTLKRLAAGAVTITAVAVLALYASSLAGASHVEPVPGPDNAQPSDCPAGSTGWKYEPVTSATGVGDGTLSVDVTVNETDAGQTFDFTANLPLVTVFVKGGPVANAYVYNPAVTSDTGLHAPVNPSNDTYYGLSHLVFCYTTPPPPEKGTIIVEKQLIPDGYLPPQGGFDFSGAIVADLLDGESASAEVDAGTYTVTESLDGRPFWDLISIECDDDDSSGDLATLTATYEVDPGETVRCVFTNQKRSLLIVKKETNPQGAGGTQAFPFDASYGDFSLTEGEQNAAPLPAGSYSVEELVPVGWVLESATCNNGDEPDAIELPADTVVTCTFVNAPAPETGTIVVKKVTVPSGDTTEFDFEFDETDFTLADDEQQTFDDLEAGSYSVTENTPVGWDLTSATCSDQSDPGSIDLAAGETVTCTFTNTKRGTIIVEKVTVPSGDVTEFDFQFGDGGFALADGEQEVIGNLEAGTYGVSENTPEGWDLTSAICSDQSDPEEIALSAGETVTCTFTNTKRGTIVVQKQTSPDGSQGSFTFTGDAAGSIGDGGQLVVSNLEPGTYTSTESAASGWLLTSIECDGEESDGDLATRTATFELDAGEIVTCVFTNAQQTVGKGSIDVQKSADPTSIKEPGGSVQFSVRITNTSTVDVAITNVVDNVYGDLDDSGGSGCFDVPINLAPGESVSCQFTGQVTGAAGTEHVNVVCADATDEFGNPLKDCDDARVTITPRLIDLVIVKNATSPTPLNGTVNYSLTVTNKGPDTATNVQMADPAPAGIAYQSATPSHGTCSVAPPLVQCNLGTIAPGQTVTIAITAKATAVGTHVNTATVTGAGGRETNPADNTDSAQTVVPAPLTPPTKPTKPPVVESKACLSLTVTPKMIKADGKPDRVTAKVKAAGKAMKGTKVRIKGVGIDKSARTNAKGAVVITINPRKPGLITITTVSKRDSCGARRIGVVGVFLPPLTG